MLNPKVKVENDQLEHISDSKYLIELVDGRKVDRRFNRAIIEDVQNVLGLEESEKYYTTEEICNRALWQSLSSFNKQMAEICVYDAVLCGQLPLIASPRSGSVFPFEYKIVFQNPRKAIHDVRYTRPDKG